MGSERDWHHVDQLLCPLRAGILAVFWRYRWPWCTREDARSRTSKLEKDGRLTLAAATEEWSCTWTCMDSYPSGAELFLLCVWRGGGGKRTFSTVAKGGLPSWSPLARSSAAPSPSRPRATGGCGVTVSLGDKPLASEPFGVAPSRRVVSPVLPGPSSRRFVHSESLCELPRGAHGKLPSVPDPPSSRSRVCFLGLWRKSVSRPLHRRELFRSGSVAVRPGAHSFEVCGLHPREGQYPA